MTPRYEILRPAHEDINTIADYLGQRRAGAGRRFLLALRRDLDCVARMPESGAPLDLPGDVALGVRVVPVTKFRGFLVFYKTTASGISVIRVRHGATDIEALFAPESDEGRAEP